jgi:hypothetical protein
LCVINALLYNADMMASVERTKEIERREQASLDREKEIANRTNLTHRFVDQTQMYQMPPAAAPQAFAYAMPPGPTYTSGGLHLPLALAPPPSHFSYPPHY